MAVVPNKMDEDTLTEKYEDAVAQIDAGNVPVTDSNVDEDREEIAIPKKIRNQALQDYYQMRRRWSQYLVVAMGIILVFNIFLTFAVGLEWLYFEDEWFLRLVLLGNLADILGLVYIVVKFLFPNSQGAYRV